MMIYAWNTIIIPRRKARDIVLALSVRPSVRPSVRLSVRLSVRPSVRPELFLCNYWMEVYETYHTYVFSFSGGARAIFFKISIVTPELSPLY